MSMLPLVCGIDVGGTKTEVCWLESTPNSIGKILSRERFATQPNSRESEPVRYRNFIQNLARQVVTPLTGFGRTLADVQSFGLGVPGSVDPISKRMLQGNLQFLRNQDLIDDLRTEIANLTNQTISAPFLINNDANCFVLVEAFSGAGKIWAGQNQVALKDLCVVGITLGTGVGGGIVMHGQLLQGRRGGAAEIGHTTLFDSGRPCYCGKFGCAERYLSGKGLEESYLLRSGENQPIAAHEIFRRADAHDPIAIATIESFRDDLVQFISNLANILDPHCFILGGGLSTQARIYPGLADRLSRACFLTENPPAVLQNHFGDSAGVLGAALLGSPNFGGLKP